MVNKVCFGRVATATTATVATLESCNSVFSAVANATFATVATLYPITQDWAGSTGVCHP